MVFVDTSGWYAMLVSKDPRHAAVRSWGRANQKLFTTDFVIDESLTLLRARKEFEKALDLGREAFDLRIFEVHSIDEADCRRAWEIFRSQPRREWSFTDCTSKVVIERFHIHQALTFDRHFLEFGNLTLVP